MILKENLTNEELDIAIEETKDFPTFLMTHYCLKHQRNGTYPGIKWRSFWLKTENNNRVDFIVRICIHPGLRNFLMIAGDRDIEKDVLFEALNEIKSKTVNLLEVNGPVIICCRPLAGMLIDWYNKNSKELKLSENPCLAYYMNNEQRNKLLNDCKNGITINEDYYWDKVDPEKDAQIFYDTWPYSSTGDLETTRDKLAYMPSSMIKSKKTNEPVAFEMTDASGFMNHLFTYSEHRNNGLGSAVEKDLCKKLINNDYVPFKTVILGNDSVIASSNKNSYWTKWIDDFNEPVIVSFLRIFPRNK